MSESPEKEALPQEEVGANAVEATEPAVPEGETATEAGEFISIPDEKPEEDVSKRLFVRPINYNTSMDDIENLFVKVGPVIDISLKPGYGFIEYEHLADAERAIQELNNDSSLGYEIQIEKAMARGAPKQRLSEGEPRPPRPEAKHRILVNGVKDHFSWQDLKDLSRTRGVEAVFTKVDFDNVGIIDVVTPEDRDSLLGMGGSEWKGTTLEVSEDSRGPAPPPSGGRRGSRGGRFGGRGGRGGRGDRFGGDRFGGDRFGGDRDRFGGRGRGRGGRGGRFGDRDQGDRYDRRDRFDRRDRGRSDRRGGYERDRSRSPPPRRQEEPSW